MLTDYYAPVLFVVTVSLLWFMVNRFQKNASDCTANKGKKLRL